jgi:hypothetical protein
MRNGLARVGAHPRAPMRRGVRPSPASGLVPAQMSCVMWWRQRGRVDPVRPLERFQIFSAAHLLYVSKAGKQRSHWGFFSS